MEAKYNGAICGQSDSLKPGAFSSVTQGTLAVPGSTNYYENGFTFSANGNVACFQLGEGYLQCFYQFESYQSKIKGLPYLLTFRSNSFIACGSCHAGSDMAWLFRALAALIALNYLMENIFQKQEIVNTLRVILTMVWDSILKGRESGCCHIQGTLQRILLRLAHQVDGRK